MHKFSPEGQSCRAAPYTSHRVTQFNFQQHQMRLKNNDPTHICESDASKLAPLEPKGLVWKISSALST